MAEGSCVLCEEFWDVKSQVSVMISGTTGEQYICQDCNSFGRCPVCLMPLSSTSLASDNSDIILDLEDIDLLQRRKLPGTKFIRCCTRRL